MELPLGLLDEMNNVIAEENREHRRQEARARAKRGH
jgi:hypothetical protein